MFYMALFTLHKRIIISGEFQLGHPMVVGGWLPLICSRILYLNRLNPTRDII